MDYLLGISVTIILGYLIGKLIALVKVPSVAGYVIVGLFLGKSCLGIIGPDFINGTGVIGDIALGFIAFTIGGELILETLKKIGGRVFVIAFFESFCAFLLVFLGMLLLKQSLSASLLLGAVASATAPAATLMVINELKAKGPLTSTLLAVVAIDDAICLMIFSLASSIASIFISESAEVHISEVILGPMGEIFGSLALGVLLGLLLVVLLKFARGNQEVLIVVIFAVFAATGIAGKFELSSLLTNMALGVTVSNLSEKQHKAFYVIESISAPIYIAFFVIAGSRLQLNMLVTVGVIGPVYALLRAIGKVGGASFGATITKADPVVKKYIGCGLISQIGVAVGLAIVISHQYTGTPIGDLVITVLLSTTIITEIVGPLLARFALIRSGEGSQRKPLKDIEVREEKVAYKSA